MGLMLAAAPLAASPAAAAPAPVVTATTGMAVGDFYAARHGEPLWFSASAGNAPRALLDLLKSADTDGLAADRYGTAALEAALTEAATGKRKAIGRADAMFSQAFAVYVLDLKQQPNLGIIYVDAQLRPAMPTPRAVLEQAAAAPSLDGYVRTMGWMNPIYGQLRQAVVDHRYANDHERELLELNLERARALPAGKGRFVMVNAAEQRLYMWDDRQPVDSMRVVVGKPKNPTPLMAAYIRFASLNPYWYVPPDLATERVAPKVLKQGLKYLDELGYEVMSDWTRDATMIDPKTIDWKGVADGKVEVMIRQKPGPHNSMGRIKFMFPNEAGVYLHDNPERELFEQAARLYSGGCVRLEDAWRLSQWLFHRELTWEGAGTEEPVPLSPPVPVFITYLTAMPSGSTIAYFDDVYGRDKAKLASLGGGADTGLTAAR
ncbi:MAG TPA: L,D-transpeptidase family protein [Sphingomicrobium sp.]|nr:L,D-transpeptidase family protein [Sphingomicrobium sp.]